MKKCPYCAGEIQDEAIKCKHCREMLPRLKNACPKCLKEYDNTWKICVDCGLPLGVPTGEVKIKDNGALASTRKIKLWKILMIIGIVLISLFSMVFMIAIFQGFSQVFKASNYLRDGIDAYKKKEYNQALYNCDKAIEYSPHFAKAYDVRGLAYISKGDINKGISDFNKAIELSPHSAVFYFDRGLADAAGGNYDQAITDNNKAISINPKFSEAYFSKAVAYAKKGDYDQMLENVQKAQSLGFKVDPAFLDKLKNASKNARIQNVHYVIQEPKGTTMDLVPYTYKSFNFNSDIKYPAKWYLTEASGGAPSLYFTPEPIINNNTKYKTGVAIIYSLNYFLNQEPPNSSLGKTSKRVFHTRSWGTVKEGIIESLKSQKEVSDLSQEDTIVAGQPALEVNFVKQNLQVRGYYVKAGIHLLGMVFEAPKDEYPEYRKTFDDMLASFSFGKDFALEDEGAILSRKLQEFMAKNRQ